MTSGTTGTIRVVAVHQPNFLPWLGYFAKIARADTFVIYDSAQFPKTGAGTWTNRVKLLMNGAGNWATMPVVRTYHGTRRTDEMEIDDSSRWRAKLVKTMRHSYARAPFFAEIFPLAQSLIEFPSTNVARFNEHGIRALMQVLGLTTPLVRSSEMKPHSAATDALIDLVKEAGGTAYLSGDGAEGYQENEKFAEAGLRLEKLNFAHPTYSQGTAAEFVPGLSVIDALMWVGPASTSEMLRSACAG